MAPSLCACTAFKTGVADRNAGRFLAASAYALASMVNCDVALAELREASLRRGGRLHLDPARTDDKCHRPRPQPE